MFGKHLKKVRELLWGSKKTPAHHSITPRFRRWLLKLEELESRLAPSVSLTTPGSQFNYEGASVNRALRATDTTPGAIVSYHVVNLPGGLVLNPSSGHITGTVRNGTHVNSPYHTILTATDGTHSDSKTITWVVDNPVSIVNPGDSFVEGAPRTLAIGLGISSRAIDNAQDDTRQAILAQGAGWTVTSVTFGARVTYTLSGGAGNRCTGRVTWSVNFYVSIVATNPAGQVIRQDIPMQFISGEYNNANLNGVAQR